MTDAITLFLEDSAHEQFLTAMTLRIARISGVPSEAIRLQVRNAAGGFGRAVNEYQSYLRDIQRGQQSASLVIVARDSDCLSRQEVANELVGKAERIGYTGQVVCAVPVPHIERWYTLDREAFFEATNGATLPHIEYRCEKGYYKTALVSALKAAGTPAPLIAAPYGQRIAETLDLDLARSADTSFDDFFTDLRQSMIAYR